MATTSDRILRDLFKHVIDLIGQSKATADAAVKLVHSESTNVKVCAAHASMVELQVANLVYMKALGEGMEALLTGAMTVLDERVEKRNWGALLIYANLVLFSINILLQFIDVAGMVK